ncbi:MAG: hybrid sensor histidine kinase/response regulator [Chloroflexi bacterium]|nr:hybrid sensor histidine kinase/response regulator [Chloroflexota bacterium]
MPPLVFVVDGDTRTPILLKGTQPLTGAKFDVRAAAEGVAAFRFVEQNKPDLIVLSAELPGKLSWQEMVRGFRKAGVRAPVILVTQNKDLATGEALDLGVRDVLHKPLTGPVLRESLRSALADVQYRKIVPPASPAPKEVRRGMPAGLSEVDVLYAIGKSVTSLTDLEEILHRVVEAAVFLTSAEQGFLMLLDEESQELILRAAKNISDQVGRTLRLRTSDGIAGQVVKTGKPILLGGEQQTKIKTSFLVRSALYVPLKTTGRVIGVLSVDNQRSARAFTERNQRFLSAAADYAAIAIENSRLLQGQRDRAAALEIAYRELEETDALKTHMIQNLSHELRTPLVFIKGYVDMLETGALMDVPAEVRDGLKTVQRRINDLVKIVENTVALSQPARETIVTEDVVLGELIQAAVDKRMADAEKAGIVMVVDLPPTPIHVLADQRQVGQVLGNLLDNAVKFSPNGGLITVAAQALDRQLAEVQVSDSGVGIPADKVDKVFERFFQVDGSATRRYGGTGLGLAAAREIIQAHGGDLSVVSKPGRGSVFRFTLYLADAAPKISAFQTA